MRQRIENIRRHLAEKQFELKNGKALCERYQKESEESLRRLENVDAAIEVIRSVSNTLQDSVRLKVQSIVQTALDATFPGNTFLMEFVPRRDKMDIDMFICDEHGDKQNILYGNGGGVKDIISFALRVAVWSLDDSASDVIVLDEPMKFMSAGCRYQGAELLNILSKDLGVQFIVVSHVPEIIETADIVYRVQLDGDRISRAKLLKGN